jgi:hypothetical protein
LPGREPLAGFEAGPPRFCSDWLLPTSCATGSPTMRRASPPASGVRPCAFASFNAASAISLASAAFWVIVSRTRSLAFPKVLFSASVVRMDAAMPAPDGQSHSAEHQRLTFKHIGQILLDGTAPLRGGFLNSRGGGAGGAGYDVARIKICASSSTTRMTPLRGGEVDTRGYPTGRPSVPPAKPWPATEPALADQSYEYVPKRFVGCSASCRVVAQTRAARAAKVLSLLITRD